MTTTVNMQTDMTVKDKATRLWAIMGLCSLGLCITACDEGEMPAGGKGPAKIELRFSASISDSPSTKAVVQPPRPPITEGTAFADGTHKFGLFITRDGTALVPGSGDNMQSTLTKSGTSQTWSHADKTGSSDPINLVVNNGDQVMIRGYYPWIGGADSTAVPFDLSSTDPTTWADLLYLSSPTGSQQITDAGSTIPLTFSHAFCWVTVNLLKLSDSEVKVKAVGIGNAFAGQGRILNKGTLNLTTGEITGTSGPLKIIPNSPVTLDTEGAPNAQSAVFDFLVPPVMLANIKNSDLVIEITTLENTGTSVEEKVLTFPLSLTHLNYDAEKQLYGFEQGKHNTYNIVYNNSAMNLSLSDWQTAAITDAKLGEGTVNANIKTRIFSTEDALILGLSSISTNKYKLDSKDHRYHYYLGEVADNNNGGYQTFSSDPSSSEWPKRWQGAVLSEPVNPKLQFSENFAAGGAQVAWKDAETGALLAKQACVEFRDGGYSDWRLPRISECYMMAYQFPFIFKDCWSATEENSTHSYAIVKEAYYIPKSFSKQELFYVRCVRDADKPKPTK